MKIHLLAAIVLLPGLLGCQENTPEARLESAGDKLESSEDTLESIESQIAEQEQLLAELRKQRRKLRERVLTLEERVAARATDVALFRSVQTALLEDERLVRAAVSVDVEGGVIRLSGRVTSDAELKTAEDIARTVPGVDVIESRIEVEPDETSTE